MSKPPRRVRRPGGLPARTRVERPLVDRILDTPHPALAVRGLSPVVLHRVIQQCGLEACGDLLALATPDQLRRVLDLDLWRAGSPGRDEAFDADRFGPWLEVLVNVDAAVAAEQLSRLDADVVIAGLAQHARVFDGASTDEHGCEIGGYCLVPLRAGSWDAIMTALKSLEADHHDFFRRVMRGCTRLSNSDPEIDGLHDLFTDRAQAMFDLAFGREQRREQQGFVIPAEARAFLRMSRECTGGRRATPSGNPVARAYFRTVSSATVSGPEQTPHEQPESPAAESPASAADAVAAILEVLTEAGVVTPPPRALLAGAAGGVPRFARLQAHMQFARDRDEGVYLMRTQELAFIANTLMAGCSIQGRPFTQQEAFDAAAAACNLGLENWPGELSDTLLAEHDLVSVFQAGWTVLYERVCVHAAGCLLEVLTDLRVSDREIQVALDALRLELTKQMKAGEPWRARDALDVIAILDTPAWAALLGLIDECPVAHAAIAAARRPRTHRIAADAFEFVSENSQISAIHEFLRALPETLSL